jgi:hypothetical protein
VHRATAQSPRQSRRPPSLASREVSERFHFCVVLNARSRALAGTKGLLRGQLEAGAVRDTCGSPGPRAYPSQIQLRRFAAAMLAICV